MSAAIWKRMCTRKDVPGGDVLGNENQDHNVAITGGKILGLRRLRLFRLGPLFLDFRVGSFQAETGKT